MQDHSEPQRRTWWTTGALDASGVTGFDKLVLVCLADYADADGKCWPRVATVAGRLGVAKNTVHRCLKRLDEAGLIERHTNRGPNGVNLYVLKCKRVSAPLRRVV